MENFFLTLNESSGSVALRESLYAYAWIETAHIAALAFFLGLVWALDLRLIGVGYRGFPVSGLQKMILPWCLAGFVVVMSTGLLLFYANPVRVFHSVWFRFKVCFLVASALNVVFFHLYLNRDRSRWDSAWPPPRAARAAGALSLAGWVAVIIMGRLIAFDWLDCDRGPPPWAAWVAGCARETR